MPLFTLHITLPDPQETGERGGVSPLFQRVNFKGGKYYKRPLVGGDVTGTVKGKLRCGGGGGGGDVVCSV